VKRSAVAPDAVPARQRLPLKFIGEYVDNLLSDLAEQIVSGEAERRAAAAKKQARAKVKTKSSKPSAATAGVTTVEKAEVATGGGLARLPSVRDPRDGVNERLEERRRREAELKAKQAKELAASREAVRAKQGRLAAKLEAQRRAKETAARLAAAEAAEVAKQQVRGRSKADGADAEGRRGVNALNREPWALYSAWA
jgi:hypothetical protein